jgi:hypothetical protein
VALADPELSGGGILDVIGEEVEHLLVDLDCLEPLLQLLKRPALPQDGVGGDLRLGELNDEGVVFGEGPRVVLGGEDLVCLVERDPLEGVEFGPFFIGEARLLAAGWGQG